MATELSGSSIEYRPAIDGLRAVAVVAVLIFHLSPHLLAGGFVGVDVFFVISGFLITSIVLDELKRGEFSIARFYQRRIARIFPLLFVVVVATLIGAWWIYPGEDIASTGAASVAALASAANMKFMMQGDYFKLEPDTQPLLHTWSLSVEEQFYVILPPLVVLLFTKRSSSRIAWYLGSLLILGFIFSNWLTVKNHTSAFFLMPSRAWELLVGCVAACCLKSFGAVKWIPATLCVFLGFFGICISFICISESPNFPGYLAAAPTIAAVMVIVAERFAKRNIVGRFLEHDATVFVGKISYSLYLWHWPIYAMVDYRMLLQPFSVRLLTKIALTLLLSIITYKMIEVPARRYLAQPRNRRLAFVFFLLGSLGVGTMGWALWKSQYLDSSIDLAKLGGVVVNPGADRMRIAIYGDSTGSMYGKPLADAAKRYGFELHILSVAGQNPMPESALFRQSEAWLQSNPVDVIILSAHWIGQTNLEASQELIDRLRVHTKFLVVLDQPPMLPDRASRRAIREQGICQVFEEDWATKQRYIWQKWKQQFTGPQFEFVDVHGHFLNTSGDIRLFDDSARLLYQDRLHLSQFGANEVVKEITPVLLKFRGR